MSSFSRGAELGCPTCEIEEEHVCPFLYVDEKFPEPGRSRALNHMRSVLKDETVKSQMRVEDGKVIVVSTPNTVRWVID